MSSDGCCSLTGRNILVAALSLGVYATAWTYYGGVGLAANSGYLYVTIYLGATLAFLLAPVLLRPLLRLVREYQLSSLADVFAFRFRFSTDGPLSHHPDVDGAAAICCAAD